MGQCLILFLPLRILASLNLLTPYSQGRGRSLGDLELRKGNEPHSL